MMKKLDRHYMSELDKFLHKKRQDLAVSASQQQEMAQYEKIFEWRDHPRSDGNNVVFDLDK